MMDMKKKVFLLNKWSILKVKVILLYDDDWIYREMK
jgi:hypothetical protein